MKLRMQITKEAGIRFVSHLEYTRTIERAMRRAKLPVAYSEGFNPHMKFSLASALGVGITSQAEFLEIELAKDINLEIAIEKLSAALPMGIHVKAADLVENKAAKLMASVGGADYYVQVPCLEECREQIERFNMADSVLFQKPIPKGRGKTKEIQVKDFIQKIEWEYNNNKLELKFACKITPTGSMKATELLKILKDQFAVPLVLEQADIERRDLYALNDKGRKKVLIGK
jgi:radical SAM-linked protein